MSSRTVEHLNKGHLYTEGFDPYSEVVGGFYKQPCTAILWFFTTYLNDYDMKPLYKKSEATLFKSTLVVWADSINME